MKTNNNYVMSEHQNNNNLIVESHILTWNNSDENAFNVPGKRPLKTKKYVVKQ